MRLLRRVPRMLVHDGVIESSNFRETEAGRGLSVTLWASDQDLEDVRRFNEDLGVVWITAEVLRAAKGIIVRAPLVGNLNHCELFPRFSGGQQKQIRKTARWAHCPDWVAPEHRSAMDALGGGQ